VRNIGSSIGISIVSALLVRNTQVNHAEIAALMTPYNPVLAHAMPSAVTGNPAALSSLDGLATQQALMVAYVDDFKFMFVVTLIAMGLTLFMRSPRHGQGAAPAAAMAE
jgi:DHA2 family multidrug resistance protein